MAHLQWHTSTCGVTPVGCPKRPVLGHPAARAAGLLLANRDRKY